MKIASRAEWLLPFGLSLLMVLASTEADASKLTKAARKGRLADVQALIARGVDLDEADWRGNAPIYYAAREGHAEIVAALGAAGADVDIENGFGSTPLHLAARNGHVEVIRVLAQLGALLAPKSADLDLLDDDLGRPGHVGGTPLRRAAAKGQLEAVKVLIEVGAPLPDRQAVDAASSAGHSEIARYIVQATRASAGSGQRSSRRTAGPPAPTTFRADYVRRVAVVIGISHYANMSDLEGATRDARAVAARLREGGFDEVIELYDADATREAMLEKMGVQLQTLTSERDLAFVYFAGHGTTETLPSGEKRGYLLPTDGRPEMAYSSGISMEMIRDLANRLPARHVFYAVDACYSGSLELSRGQGTPEAGGVRHRAVQMMTAGTEGQQAVERGGRGLFTSYALQGLQGAADRNRDGVVTANELGYFVSTQVAAATGRKQTPRYGRLDGSGEVVLQTLPSEASR